MWQDAAITQNSRAQQPPETPPARAKADGKKQLAGALFWGQMLLCALLLGLALAGRQFGLPWYRELRGAYHQWMAQDSGDFFFDGRNFIKFTQQAAARVQGALDLPGDGESGADAAPPQGQNRRRGRSGQSAKEAPYGSSLESYLPAMAAAYPLGTTAATNSGYGWRASPAVLDTDEDFHTGDDLNAAEGAPVYAAMDGIVRWAGCGKSYGNYIRILHADGAETLYAHLQYVFVRGGERVGRGRQIGTVGQTGKATGPHLHFELLNGGVRCDPTEFLQRLCGQTG